MSIYLPLSQPLPLSATYDAFSMIMPPASPLCHSLSVSLCLCLSICLSLTHTPSSLITFISFRHSGLRSHVFYTHSFLVYVFIRLFLYPSIFRYPSGGMHNLTGQVSQTFNVKRRRKLYTVTVSNIYLYIYIYIYNIYILIIKVHHYFYA